MMTLKGIFPETKPTKSKNFIRENVKNIHRISLQSVKEEKDKKIDSKGVGSVNKEKKDKRNISANVLFYKSDTKGKKVLTQENCYIRQVKRDNSKVKKGAVKNDKNLIKTSSDPNLRHENNSGSISRSKVVCISRGIQTSIENDTSEDNSEGNPCNSSKDLQISTDDYFESVNSEEIKSKKLEITNEDLSGKRKEKAHVSGDTNVITENLPQVSNSAKNFTENSNTHSDIKTKLMSSKSKPLEPKHRLGVVPKYLLERKEAILKEKQEKEAELSQPPCPEGHILLPDQERKETLTMLKKSYQDCINDLNRLPIRSDTLRAHQKKMDLEKQLNKLEEGIKVFSRPKVFVKINS